MNPRCEKCAGCYCQNPGSGLELGGAGGGGARPNGKMTNNNSQDCPTVYAKFKETAGGGGNGGGVGAKMINNDLKARAKKCPIVYAKFKETAGGGGNGGGGGGGNKMINNDPRAPKCPIVYAKFKEDNSSSINGGTITRPAVMDLLPQVSPGESSRAPDQSSSSVQNENENISASGGGGGGGGYEAARYDSEKSSEGAPTPVRNELKVQEVKQASEESDTSDSIGDFVPPWLRASDGAGDLDPCMMRTREKVLDWLERNERAAAAGELQDVPDSPADELQPGPGERPEESEEWRELRIRLKKLGKEGLRAGAKLPGPARPSKQVAVLSNVEFFAELNPPQLAVTICALLNSGGGHIYIGLDALSVIRGVRISRAERDGARQMLDIINKDHIEPSVSPTDTDIEFMEVAGLRDEERLIRLSVRRVVTNILYRVKRVDTRGFQNGVYIRTSEGANQHVK